METIYHKVLKAIRLGYRRFHPLERHYIPCEENPDKASEIITKLLEKEGACMIARYGSNEAMMTLNYLGIFSSNYRKIDFIIKDAPAWWWDDRIRADTCSFAGLFPNKEDVLKQFGEQMIEDTKEVDCLACWNPYEYHFLKYLKSAKFIQLQVLDPYWSYNPWTSVLAGKRILVVHPFQETILAQYEKRKLLFSRINVLPDFASLRVIKAVQSIGGCHNKFGTWFDALDWMKKEIEKEDFDICLIGCGAYGFPLAAHVKRLGKKAVHMGGPFQLSFGIIGSRWDSRECDDYLHYPYSKLKNESWVRPNVSDRPKTYLQVENGCYW